MYNTSSYSFKKTRTIVKKLAEEKQERYIARGKKTVAQLAEFARKIGEEKITIIEEKDGEANLENIR
ncbi:hypothetical protein HZC07_01160, partial [Candidatus Micrarchaeota archaeon]|nr:hypothetical protein [Candidatus Micrarchaeota archaeon]